jgi:hypothetical protein
MKSATIIKTVCVLSLEVLSRFIQIPCLAELPIKVRYTAVFQQRFHADIVPILRAIVQRFPARDEASKDLINVW